MDAAWVHHPSHCTLRLPTGVRSTDPPTTPCAVVGRETIIRLTPAVWSLPLEDSQGPRTPSPVAKQGVHSHTHTHTNTLRTHPRTQHTRERTGSTLTRSATADESWTSLPAIWGSDPRHGSAGRNTGRHRSAGASGLRGQATNVRMGACPARSSLLPGACPRASF